MTGLIVIKPLPLATDTFSFMTLEISFCLHLEILGIKACRNQNMCDDSVFMCWQRENRVQVEFTETHNVQFRCDEFPFQAHFN